MATIWRRALPQSLVRCPLSLVGGVFTLVGGAFTLVGDQVSLVGGQVSLVFDRFIGGSVTWRLTRTLAVLGDELAQARSLLAHLRCVFPLDGSSTTLIGRSPPQCGGVRFALPSAHNPSLRRSWTRSVGPKSVNAGRNPRSRSKRVPLPSVGQLAHTRVLGRVARLDA